MFHCFQRQPIFFSIIAKCFQFTMLYFKFVSSVQVVTCVEHSPGPPLPHTKLMSRCLGCVVLTLQVPWRVKGDLLTLVRLQLLLAAPLLHEVSILLTVPFRCLLQFTFMEPPWRLSPPMSGSESRGPVLCVSGESIQESLVCNLSYIYTESQTFLY